MILAVLLELPGTLRDFSYNTCRADTYSGARPCSRHSGSNEPGAFAGMTPQNLFVLMIVLAVARGILHYAEQYCNHFIAFKLLAIIRHKVFAALRRLCPAKLEGPG